MIILCRLSQEPTRYLNGEELQRCLRLFWEMTNEEMKASNMKGGDSGDVFDVQSVDGALAILAKYATLRQ